MRWRRLLISRCIRIAALPHRFIVAAILLEVRKLIVNLDCSGLLFFLSQKALQIVVDGIRGLCRRSIHLFLFLLVGRLLIRVIAAGRLLWSRIIVVILRAAILLHLSINIRDLSFNFSYLILEGAISLVNVLDETLVEVELSL